LVEPVQRLELPSSVQAVLAARIDRLPRSAKTLLQIAAVIGQVAPLALLERVADLAEDDVRLALAELRSAELLYETRLLPDVEYTFKHALTHAVAYGSLVADRRRAIHLDVVRALELRYADRLDDHLERLANHALAAEQWQSAVVYLLRAARRAIQRSAHQEAIDLLRYALGALERLPGSRRRLEHELDIQKAMGVTMMAAKGWGAPEVVDAYNRAQVLCEQLADERELFTVLRGKGQFHMIRGELDTARQLGARCVELAQGCDDVGVRIETHHLFWSNSFFMGDYANAEAHANHGIELYRSERDHPLTYVYSGHDPGVCCRCFSGLVLWQHGQPDRALERCREALALATQLSNPLTLALAQWGLSYVHMFRREPAAAYEWAKREIDVCNEYLLALLLSQGTFQLGWALAQQGEAVEGIARMNEGLAAITATGAEMGLPYFRALLAEAHAKNDSLALGLAEIERAIAAANRNGAHFQMPEILRIKGDLLSMRRITRKDAVLCYRQAIEAARRQRAKSLELRAATSLLRMSTATHRRAAHDLLAGIYAQFAKGLASIDLEEAKALLDAFT
jgi:predicted ATPase